MIIEPPDLYRHVYSIPGRSQRIHIAAEGWEEALELLEQHVRENADIFPPWPEWKRPHSLATYRIYEPRNKGFMMLEWERPQSRAPY